MNASYYGFIVIVIGIASANTGYAADLGPEITRKPASEHGCEIPSDQNIDDWKSEALTGHRGNTDSQNLLGLSYSLGCGVPQDDEQALGWFRLAAEQGDATAQFNLGGMYALGLGTPQNFELAVKWYELSADQGNASAQGELGVMYANGSGVQKNKIVAFALYTLCTENNLFDSSRILANRAYLAMNMTVMEINESGTLAREMARPCHLLKSIERFIARSAVLSANSGRLPKIYPPKTFAQVVQIKRNISTCCHSARQQGNEPDYSVLLRGNAIAAQRGSIPLSVSVVAEGQHIGNLVQLLRTFETVS